MILVIAEKPSVAQTIAAVLGAKEKKDGFLTGSGYIVSWCVGHLVGLAEAAAYGEQYKKWSYDSLPILPQEWKYTVASDKEKQFKTLKELMHRADVSEVVNACDAGREGELIFRFVYEMAGCKKPMRRLWISSMEDSAIKEGFSRLKNGEEYDALFASALCRAKADWLIGINATRLFSVLYNHTLNVGRVQTPTLKMINREYTDDTLKNLQVIPISFPKLMIGKLTTIGLLSILLGLCNSFVTIIVGIIACRENMTLSTIIIGTIQICGMALFTFIGEMPLIAHCGKKQNSFKGGAVAAFLLGYISIYFKNPIIRNLYPLSAGLSIVGFNGEGFVTDTTGAYSSSQSILLGVLTMLAMLILSLIIISIPQKETLATPLSQKRRKTERKIAK